MSERSEAEARSNRAAIRAYVLGSWEAGQALTQRLEALRVTGMSASGGEALDIQALLVCYGAASCVLEQVSSHLDGLYALLGEVVLVVEEADDERHG